MGRERGEAGCCAPDRGAEGDARPVEGRTGGLASTDGMVRLEAEAFLFGSDDRLAYPADGEGPVRRVEVSPFWIDACAVSTADFAAFVDATRHVTAAEAFGWSFVFAGLLPDDFPPTQAVAQAPWWRSVEGADWRRPEGPHASLEDRGDHPVVHVSWHDVQAYCAWAGKRLPTEAEWELAARGGLVGKRFTWGDERRPGGRWQANTFQGSFPDRDAGDDRFRGTAPVGSFPPNGFGLFDMSGNVWEWCADYFRPDTYRVSPARDPQGPADSFDPDQPGTVVRVLRGGSFLCSDDYCLRYTVAARNKAAEDTGSSHVGLRCARSAAFPD